MGLTAIVCACIFRLFAIGAPEKLWNLLTQPNTAAFLIYLETGHDVRFSPSLEAFSPEFVETPAPVIPEPTEEPLPSFSDPEAVELYYGCRVSPDIGELLVQPLSWDLTGEGPTVLILHTHTTESYTKNGESYREVSQWRTLDEEYNMLKIGEHLVELLKQKGITAVQDREIHDYPSYNGSYTHARKSVEAWLTEYPTIQLVLDLHRDASGGDSGQLRTLAEVDGERSAQLMVVLGTNHERYEENLCLGLKLHAALEQLSPGVARPLQLRGQRFNQDLCPGMLLIEVGAAGNTQEEALRASGVLAEAVALLARGTGP